MRVDGVNFIMLGAYYEWSNRSVATISLRSEYLHSGYGLWAQLGPLIDLEKVRAGFMVAAGWSVVGLEFQQRSYEGFGATSVFLAKVRLPIGVFLQGILH